MSVRVIDIDHTCRKYKSRTSFPMTTASKKHFYIYTSIYLTYNFHINSHFIIAIVISIYV